MNSENNTLRARACRLCTEICKPDKDYLFLNCNEYLVGLIAKYISIKIAEDDILPRQICEMCRERIVSFDEYSNKCIIKQITLTSIFLPNKEISVCDPLLKIEDEIDIEELNKDEIFDETSKQSENDGDIDNLSDLDVCISPKNLKIKLLKTKQNTKEKVKRSKSSLKGASSISSLHHYVDKDDQENIPLKIKKNSTPKTSILNFDCHICKEVFLEWHLLSKHTNQDHGVKPKVTCLCGKFLTNRDTAYKHTKKHAVDLPRCDQCNKPFITERNLVKHLILEHSGSKPSEFKCQKCYKVFTKSYFLKQHEKSHLPKDVKNTFKCEICAAMFASNCHMIMHLKAVHSKEKPFVCDICGHSFSNKGSLKCHIITHSDLRPYTCSRCPKSFKNKTSLRRHAEVHSEATYKCSKCPSKFSYKKRLQEHMTVHDDTCRFVCSFCNKGFKWRRSLQTHVNNHTGKTPYSCPWCPKTFADGPNCRIHKRRKHPIELANYETKNGL